MRTGADPSQWIMAGVYRLLNRRHWIDQDLCQQLTRMICRRAEPAEAYRWIDA